MSTLNVLNRPILGITAACLIAAVAAGWLILASRQADSLRSQARAAMFRSAWEEADGLLNRLAWYRPQDREVLNMRVRTALQLNQPVKAARLLARIPGDSAETAGIRLQQARLLIQAFRPREANAALKECLVLDPSNDAARLTRIAILAFQHRAREYDEEAWRLFEHGSEPIKALRLLAQAAPVLPPDTFTNSADMGDVLRRCQAAEPDDLHTRIALCRFDRERGAIAEALEWIKPCMDDSMVGADGTIEWAMCLLDDGDLDGLRAYFETPPAEALHLSGYHFLRGEWRRRRGDRTGAIEGYREAFRLDPRASDAAYQLGLALRESDPDARRYLDIARKARDLKQVVTQVSDRSTDPAELARIGRLCSEIGRNREAKAWLSLALKYDPKSEAIRSELDVLDRTR